MKYIRSAYEVEYDLRSLLPPHGESSVEYAEDASGLTVQIGYEVFGSEEECFKQVRFSHAFSVSVRSVPGINHLASATMAPLVPLVLVKLVECSFAMEWTQYAREHQLISSEESIWHYQLYFESYGDILDVFAENFEVV